MTALAEHAATARPSPAAGVGPPAGPSAVAAALQARLAERYARDGYRPSPAAPAPLVVALGPADLLGWERSATASAPRPMAGHRDATVHVTAQAVLIGPWGASRPPGACGHCLAIRWQRLRPRHEREALETGSGPRAAGAWPVLPEHLVAAVWCCYRAIMLEPPAVPGKSPRLARVSRVDVRSLAVSTVLLLPEPRCPSCGPAEPAGPDTELATCPKPGPVAYRLRDTSEYELPGPALANAVCGAIGPAATALVNSPTTAPVVGAALACGPQGLYELAWSGQSHSFAASTRLAFIEGLERYAGTMRRRPGLVVDSYDNLGDRALDPRRCGSYPPSAYGAHRPLTPFAPDRPIPWVTGYSLRDRRPVLVPVRLAYYGWDGGAEMFTFECSNGCASGSCISEAILFGLLEVIERDAFLLGWYGGADLPEIDAATASTAARAMIDRARLRGYDIRLFDNRIDLAVPVVTGVAIRRDGGPGLLCFAAGASLHPEAAAEAALCEILTYIPALPAKVISRREELERMADDYSLVRVLADHQALFGLPRMAGQARHYTRPADPRPMAEVYRSWQRERPATTDLGDDVRFCVTELARAGFDVIVVDQTTSEQQFAGLSSVRVIVPGLLPIDFGWAMQRAPRLPRMLTALRRGGRRATDLTPAELHMVPHPFP
ncbi:MAG TPA: TOMM precursor leader peptide-binding protein [Streptosporangiaceae bacterium]|nr:TOMM precursor leader peptide-binding protein [Streptosporangiaceae bacterium]